MAVFEKCAQWSVSPSYLWWQICCIWLSGGWKQCAGSSFSKGMYVLMSPLWVEIVVGSLNISQKLCQRIQSWRSCAWGWPFSSGRHPLEHDGLQEHLSETASKLLGVFNSLTLEPKRLEQHPRRSAAHHWPVEALISLLLPVFLWGYSLSKRWSRWSSCEA